MSPSHKRHLLLLLYAAVALPWVLSGAYQALQTNSNSPLDWVSGSFLPRRRYDGFQRVFGSGDLVILSWSGCTIDEPRLDLLAEHLRRDRRFRDAADHWYFDRTLTGRDALRVMTAGPWGIERGLAIRRLRHTLIGPDRATTCVVIGFTKSGLAERRRLVGSIQDAAEQLCDAPRESQHLAGPVMDGLSVDQASQQSLRRFVAPSALIMLFVCWLCLRSIRAALIVFCLSLFGQGVALALVHAGGDQMNAVLMVLPPLVQVLAVTGGIHLVNYYYSSARSHVDGDHGHRAFQLGWLPCTLSAVTTAIGLASLMVSQLDPVRSFGMYASAGVLVTTGLLLALVPGLLSLWPIPIPRGNRSGAEMQVRCRRVWGRLADLIDHHRPAVMGTCLGLMVAFGAGVQYVNTSVRIETLFSADSRIRQDYQWLESHVGDLVPIEIVLQCDRDCSLSQPERLELVRKIQIEAAGMEPVSGSMSALTFLPNIGPDPNLPPEAQRAWIDRSLAACRPQFASLRYLATPGAVEQWRVTAYVSAQDDMDYGIFLQHVRRRIQPLLRDAAGTPLAGVSAEYTGIMPLVHEIQRQLMSNLLLSFLGAFAVIALVMTIVHADVLSGLISMIPNVFPALIMFGAMGWRSTPMDIGSVMTASVALGIAVDDTLHYLTFFRRGLERGMDRRGAVHDAYQHCGAAMIQTTVTCGLGLAVFLFSDFVPARRFAWLMIFQLAAALAGDLVLLPALLLSPLGRLFQPKAGSAAATAVNRAAAEPSALSANRRAA